MRARTFIALTLLNLMLVFCLSGASGLEAKEHKTLHSEFRSASEKYDVPQALLKAIGYTNTRWEMPPPNASDYEKGSLEGSGAYGIMSLYENPSKDTLERASRLTAIPKSRLKREREANIEGAAAMLADIQGEKPKSINGWYDAVSEYGGGPLYANQVYEVLKSGASTTISSGEKVELKAHPEAKTQPVYSFQTTADYWRATWYGTNGNNYTNANRGAKQINYIIIHVTQGSWAGTLNWFQDPRAQVSAHYVIRSSDGKIGQSVREKNIAWHAGNWTYNEHSIGIEHEGYVSEKKWFTDAMYRSSARLSAYLCKKYNIPIDRKHIIGHYQVPGSDHTDPGPYWNWDKYMRLVKSYAGGSSTYKQIVDNSDKRFRASSAWGLSTYDSQRYGKNYRFTKPKDVNDPAKYKFKTPSKGLYSVYAWWPANPGYNGRTRFKIRTVHGWRLEVRSQRKNGGHWVRLGNFKMGRADHVVRVKIPRRSAGKGYIIADAVKIKKL